MSNQIDRPVALLIHASTGQPLTYLKEECDAIATSLKASSLCDVKIVPAATLSDVVSKINDPVLRDRIVLVHYAGHASGKGLQLRSEEGRVEGELAHMRGMAGVLKQQPHLRLLFINGCTSREQVLELTQAGIPLVIATSQGIDDKVARDFADRFYRTLKQERSIGDAFQVATDTIQASVGHATRGLYFGDFRESTSAQNNELPWEIHGPGIDRQWTLGAPYYRGTGPKWDHTKYPLSLDSPYLGLRYFSEKESDRFFGRDDLVQRLLTSNQTAPLLLVVGASGTGKSSVVRAGMIPAWKAQHQDGGPPRVFAFTPEDDPFDQLSISLATVDTFDRKQLREVRKNISLTALQDAINTFGQGEPWLIFVDQLEQVFTRTTDVRKRDAFLASIVDLAKANHSSVCLVLAMRDDFFPQLRQYPELFPITDKHLARVAALDGRALQEVIVRPAAEHGVTFEPGLVDDIVGAIEGQPGALPLLQYTLNALWNNDDLSDRILNSSTYKDLGGVIGALGRRFQQLYEQLDDIGKNEFRWMMLKLVTYDEGPGGVTVVSRLAPKSEFEGQQAEFLNELITHEKLLVSSGTSTPAVQLGHEKIIEAWAEFEKWTGEHETANTVRQQLSKAASEWTKLKGERTKAARALWQGSQLEKALELRKQGEFDELGGLDDDHDRFLDASYRRSRRMVRSLQVALCLISLLAGSAGLASWSLYWAKADIQQKSTKLQEQKTALQTKSTELNNALEEADREAAIADIRRLAALASFKGRDWPQTSILIAAEAVQRNLDRQKTDPPFPFLAEAHQALRDSLMIAPSQEPTLGYQKISPNGRWLISVDSVSSTASVWDANDFDDSATPPIASSDADERSVRPLKGVWQLKDHGGKLPNREARYQLENVDSVAFSPESTWLATWNEKSSAPNLWCLASKEPFDALVLAETSGEAPFLREGMPSATFSADGRWLLFVDLQSIRLAYSDDAKLYRLESEPPTASCVKAGSNERLFMSPGGRWLLVGRQHGEPALVDMSDGTLGMEHGFDHFPHFAEAKFSPDESILAAVDEASPRRGRGKHIRVWSLEPNAPAGKSKRFTGNQGTVQELMFSPDGRWLLSRGESPDLCAWRCRDGQVEERPVRLSGHTGNIRSIAMGGSRWLVTGAQDNTARIWDMQKEYITRSHAVLKWHEWPVTMIRVEDGRVFTDESPPNASMFDASSSNSSQTRWWRIGDSQSFVSPSVLRVSEMSGIQGQYDHVYPGHKTRFVVAMPGESTGRIIDLEKSDPFSSCMTLSSEKITPIDVRNEGGEGTYAPTAKGIRVDSEIYLWDAQDDGNFRPTVIDEEDTFKGVRTTESYRCEISADRRWIASPLNGDIRLVDLKNDYTAFLLSKPDKRRIQLGHFTPDTRFLITRASGAGPDILLWRLRSDDPSEEPLELSTDFDSVYFYASSPDGRWLAAQAEGAKVLRLWDLKSEDPAAERVDLHGQPGRFGSLSFSQNSKVLVTIGGEVHLWNLSSGTPEKLPVFRSSDPRWTELDSVTGLDGRVGADGRWLMVTPLAANGRGDTRIFDLCSRSPTQAVRSLRFPDTWAALSRDLRWAVRRTPFLIESNEVQLWDLSTSEPSQHTFVLRGHTEPIKDVVITPDSRWLITVGGNRPNRFDYFDPTIRLWDLHATDPSKTPVVLRGFEERIQSAAVSADSRWLVTQEGNGTVRIWHLSIAELLEKARTAAGRDLTPEEREDFSL